MSNAAHPRRSRMTHRISDFALLGGAWILSADGNGNGPPYT